MEVDDVVDAFVRKVNNTPRRRIREEDVPHPLRGGGAEFGLYYDWTIQRFDRINWIESLEDALQRKLPPSYRSLVTRYIFPAFDVGDLTLLANTGRTLYHEMGMAMIHDRVLSEVLLKNGYAQFARPSSGEVDPIGFDFNRTTSDGECPIVRINHADIVAYTKITIMAEIAPSFSLLVHTYLQQEPQASPVFP